MKAKKVALLSLELHQRYRFSLCERPKVSRSGLLAPRVRSESLLVKQIEKRITSGEARERASEPKVKQDEEQE
jgi:hypothetical protein